MKTLSELCTEVVVNSHNDLNLNITRQVRLQLRWCFLDALATDCDISDVMLAKVLGHPIFRLVSLFKIDAGRLCLIEVDNKKNSQICQQNLKLVTNMCRLQQPSLVSMSLIIF